MPAVEIRAMEIAIRDKSGQQVGLYENSYALVIGISDYTGGWSDLPGVEKDIAIVREVLENHGFYVTVVENPDYEELDKAFKDFINSYGRKPDDRLLFYFAGHGHTVRMSWGREMGYIVPADAPDPSKDLDGFKAKAIDMQMVEVYAKRIDSKHALFLFDSCFSGSIFALSRAVPENISYKTANPVRQFITSGSADEKVPDESIFCQQFVAALKGEADTDKDSYVTGVELGEFLQKNVINYSKGSQHPQYGKIRDSLLDKGDFVFQVPSPPPPPIPPLPPDSGFSIDDLAKEADQIETVKAAWAARLKEMERAFNAATSYEKRDVPPDRKVLAWERFLKAFTGDNPYSQEDDRMRREASQQLAYWKGEAEPSEETRPTVTPPTVAGRTKIGKDGAEMVLIPAGEFQMGSNDYDNEKPVHTVYLDAFYMDKHEVTNAQYRRFVQATGREEPVGYGYVNGEWKGGFKPWSDENFNADDQPVVCVSWEDARAYAEWAGKRLPTEAEWEKAARGGLVGKKYPWGDNITHDDANYAGTGGKDRWEYTAPVGSFAPNGYGLYDMAGNVWEWCADWYDSGYYTGPSSGTSRVLRGGSWYSYIDFNLRVASRLNLEPSFTRNYVGFRCVE
jgi:formylglycine-generating enzyme required for sulfatase activity